MTPKEMALIAAKALDEKKGGDIAAIEITEQTTLADYFVIATGSSNTQINALCGAVEKAMKEQAGEDPLRREGYRDGTWVLLDYGCVVVHVFSAEAREFYSLERLWHDGKPVDLPGGRRGDGGARPSKRTKHPGGAAPPELFPTINPELRDSWWRQPAGSGMLRPPKSKEELQWQWLQS